MRRYKRRRFSVWGLAVVLLAGCAATAAWKFQWLPVEFGEAETGSLLDSDSISASESSGQSNSENENDGRFADETVEIDPIIFSAQTEPPVNQDLEDPFSPAVPSSIRESSQRELTSRQWDDPTTPRLFPGLPAAASQGSPPLPESRATITDEAGIVPASNEVEARDDRIAVRQGSQPASRDLAASTGLNSGSIDLEKLDRLIASGDRLTAHRELSQVYWNQPELRPLIDTRIAATAMSIYFSPDAHYLEPYVIQPNDQLRRIAKQYQISWEYLADLNRIDPRRVRPGQKLKVIMGPFSAFVDLRKHELSIHAHGYFVRKYPVGIGKDTSSPLGRFRVLNKVLNPQYTNPEGRVISADDPKNPLGERWIDIGDGFGIHGTIDARSIGRDESRGCIRMHNSDVAQVYDLLTVGSEVVIQR